MKDNTKSTSQKTNFNMKPKLNLIKEESSQESNGSKGDKGSRRKEVAVSQKKNAEALKKQGTGSSFSSQAISTPDDSPKNGLLSKKKEARAAAAPTTAI